MVCADAMGIATRAKLAAAAAADADVDAAGSAAPGGEAEAAGPTFFVADTASDMWQVCIQGLTRVLRTCSDNVVWSDSASSMW